MGFKCPLIPLQEDELGKSSETGSDTACALFRSFRRKSHRVTECPHHISRDWWRLISLDDPWLKLEMIEMCPNRLEKHCRMCGLRNSKSEIFWRRNPHSYTPNPKKTFHQRLMLSNQTKPLSSALCFPAIWLSWRSHPNHPNHPNHPRTTSSSLALNFADTKIGRLWSNFSRLPGVSSCRLLAEAIAVSVSSSPVPLAESGSRLKHHSLMILGEIHRKIHRVPHVWSLVDDFPITYGKR